MERKTEKGSDFFTIGTSNVPNVDLKTESPYVSYRNKFTGNAQGLQSFLNKDESSLHAIGILYKKSSSFPELTINPKKTFLSLNSEIVVLIKENLIDFIVYGTKAPYDDCVIFTNLYNDYSNKEYILREFDNSNDRTLNRCAEDKNAFVPEKFKIGMATPGTTNDCSGEHFYLEQFLQQFATPIKPFDAENLKEIDELLQQTDAPHCTSSLDASAYQNIDDNRVAEAIEEANIEAEKSSCNALNLAADSGNIAADLDRERIRKQRLSASDQNEFEWETTAHFE